MCVSCVRVVREEGEATRRALAEHGVLDYAHEIETENGWLFIPVTSTTNLPDQYEIEERAVSKRSQQTTPADHVSFTPTYERLGDIVLVEEADDDRATELTNAILESDLPVESIARKASHIHGETRIRDWELLYGEQTETVHREYGFSYLLDIQEVYFTPRLATERRRVIEQTEATDTVFDMFAGVGPFAIPMASRGASVVATDINKTAIDYLRENARNNNVSDAITAIAGDVRDQTTDYGGWASRIVMNLPHSAHDFLPTAVHLAGDECTIHYYDIQPEDDPFAPGETVIRQAASPEYAVSVENRRIVRSYSPHEVNVCLDVNITYR